MATAADPVLLSGSQVYMAEPWLAGSSANAVTLTQAPDPRSFTQDTGRSVPRDGHVKAVVGDILVRL